MKQYTVEIHHYQEIGQTHNTPTEILEFQRESLTKRDMENIYITLMCGIQDTDSHVQAEVYVNGCYEFMVSLWRNQWELPRLQLDVIHYGKFCNIRNYKEVA